MKSAAPFRRRVYAHYKKHGRSSLPWRHTKNPYHILVSEVMLQQTQVDRVVGKYESFLKGFPDVRSLARAPLRNVLRMWQGMGYNRRARYLKDAAERIMRHHSGAVPRDEKTLRALPGVGPATAAGIMVFAYNKPALYLETNVRSAVIHNFFPGKKKVHDREVMQVLENIMDRRHPRQWYEALLDYGAFLKKTENPSRRSAHYAKQSPFRGSERELRGKVVRLLTEKRRTKTELERILGDDRLTNVLKKLEKERMIQSCSSLSITRK